MGGLTGAGGLEGLEGLGWRGWLLGFSLGAMGIGCMFPPWPSSLLQQAFQPFA